MNIPFQIGGKEYRLQSDKQDYHLCEQDQREDGSEYWRPFKWFASPGQALNRIIDMKVKMSEATTLAELKADIEAARAEVIDVWSTSSKAV